MAGFARLYDAMAPLYMNKASTQGLKPIYESPSKSSEGSRQFEPATSSGQKHPAPGGSRSGSAGTETRSRLNRDSDSDEEVDKNSSFTSYRSRASARSSLRPGGSIDDQDIPSRPSGSPRPAESSSRAQDPGRSSNLSPRPSLRIPSRGSAGDVDEETVGSRSFNRRTAGDRKPGKPYDSTDNMRLGVKDEASSSESSDSTRSRLPDTSSLSRNRRPAVSGKSDADLSRRSSRPQSSLRDDDSSLPSRQRNLGKSIEHDSPPQKSSNLDEAPYRRRKGSDEALREADVSLRRNSPRAALKLGSREDLPVRGRKEPDADSDSPPLRSSSREQPLNRRKEPTSAIDDDDIPVRRRRTAEVDSDSPPSRPAVRGKFQGDLAGAGREQSPSSKLSPRNENRSKYDDERTDSLSLSRRRDLTSKTYDADDLPSRKRRDPNMRSGSPPLGSTSRDDSLNRRNDFTSKTSDADDLPMRKRRDLNLRSGSPPLESSSRIESLTRRNDFTSKTSDAEDHPSRNRRDLSLRSRSPPLGSTSREESFNRRRDFAGRGEMPQQRRREPLKSRTESPPPRATREEPLAHKMITDDKDDSLLRRKKKPNESEEESPPSASDILPVRRRNELGQRSGRASSPPLKSSSGKYLSPSRTSEQRVPLKVDQRYSLVSRSKGLSEDSDCETPPKRREDDLQRRRNDLAARDAPLPSSTTRKELRVEWEKEPSARTGYRSGSGLSPRRRDEAPDQVTADVPGVLPKSGYRPNLDQKEGSVPNEARASQSSFRGDKEQPKAGVLKKSSSSPRQDPVEKKKPTGLHTSDSYSSSETEAKKRAPTKPYRPLLSGKTGRSLSPPSRTISKSETSPRRAKDIDSVPQGLRTGQKPLDDNKKGLGRKKEDEKGLSPRGASKGDRDLHLRRTSKDDSRLSPRRGTLRDDSGDKNESSYLRSGSRTSPREDLSLSGRRQQSLGRDLSPPRTSEQKSLFGERSKPSSRLSETDERPLVKRGQREEDTSARRALKSPAEFEFSRYELQKLRVIKLSRPLPANLSGTRYSVVEEAARHIDFVKTIKDDFKTPFLIWNDTFISTERLTQLKQFQRVNHFPGMAEICRKDLLAKKMYKLAARYPSEYKFVPRTWCLPDQLANFRQHVQEQKPDLKPSYICKPVDGASGRGIKIYKTADEVPQTVEGECVLQEYVSNPFLIEKVKFDLRLYVLITSCDPLRVYLFNDGFIRMSSEPYVDPQKCKADEELLFMHLTNCSVNKQNRPNDLYDPSRRKGSTVSGMMRPLMFLNNYLQQNKYDVALVWRNIVDLIVKTVFAAYPHILRSYRQCRPADSPGRNSVCFELLGFDVLLDAELKPWLMEVNRSPSFDYENAREQGVKLQLLEETLMLLNVSPADWKIAMQTTECPRESAKSAQKEVTDLTALLARLKLQDRMKEADTRVCQRFRRIFPVDDAAKQEKLVSQMLDAIAALVEGGAMEALQRELKAFYTSKTDEVAKKLAQLSSKTVQQLMAEGQAVSSESGSDDEDQAADGRNRVGGGAVSRRRLLETKTSAGKLATKDASKKKELKRQKLQQQQQQKQQSELTNANEREQLALRTLKFLNELSIRFPGKSNRGADQLLRQLQDNWPTRKADVSGYWRLSLDADKRQKVLDIARRNVRVALDKALRMTASDVSVAAKNLERLFQKLYNRLLWCHGQGLWETFALGAGWEAILRQSREAPTETEINCCRRVVQLCQDCLLVVYLYSDAAQHHHHYQQQQQQQQQRPRQSSVAVS